MLFNFIVVDNAPTGSVYLKLGCKLLDLGMGGSPKLDGFRNILDGKICQEFMLIVFSKILYRGYLQITNGISTYVEKVLIP